MQFPRLVVFDMAGTTVEDQGEVPAAFTAALAEHQVKVTPAQVNAVRGASKRQAITELLPPSPERQEIANRAYETFKLRLAERFAAGVRAVPGAVDTFAWLRQRQVRVALNTGFDRDITNLLLAALGWNDQPVDAVVCGDDVPCGRPAPLLIFRCMEATSTYSVHEVAVVGDTTLDLQAGANAGVRWNIGVLSGAHTREQLAPLPHTHLLASVAGLPAMLESPAPAPGVLESQAAPTQSFSWGWLKWLSNSALAPGADLTLGLCEIFPGQRNPVHFHPNCEEVLYLLSGSGMHSFAGQQIPLQAGSTLRIPPHVKHNLVNTGTEPIRCLIAFSSGQRDTVWCETLP